MSDHPLREIALSRVWADQSLPGDLRLTDGRRLHVIYPGVWSNSNGPDFTAAMVSIDGRLVRGAIELHLRASDWYRHQHDHDGAYDDVVLHVVKDDDLAEGVRTSSGTALPTLVIGDPIRSSSTPESGQSTKLLAALGSRTCLPTVSRERPELVRSVLMDRGWSRMVQKQLRFCQDLQVLTAPEALYRGLLDALGYSENRQAMAVIGERLPLTLLERIFNDRGYSGVLAALLGVGGLLSTTRAMHERLGVTSDTLTNLWDGVRRAYALESLESKQWTLNRVRPQNHPAVRLASLATLIASDDDRSLFERFLGLELDGGKAWDRWLASARPVIGEARRRQIIVNILAPFLAAYAEVTRDSALAEEVAADWERLPGNVSDRIARTTRRQIVGDARFPIRLALEEQALHDIYRNGCSELRCFECPIAMLAVEHEPWVQSASESA